MATGAGPLGQELSQNQGGQPRRVSTAQILQAAEETFARHGLSGTTMAAIAAAAGLPKANLHYYFGNKEALYKAVLENILATWLADADVWITESRLPADALRGYITAKMAWTRTRPDASRVFASEMLSGAVHIRHFLEHELRVRVERIDRVFSRWNAAGLMRPVPTRHLLFCIWAMTQSYADFSPQIEAVLGRRDGLTVADYEQGTALIADLVLGGSGIGNAPARTRL